MDIDAVIRQFHFLRDAMAFLAHCSNKASGHARNEIAHLRIGLRELVNMAHTDTNRPREVSATDFNERMWSSWHGRQINAAGGLAGMDIFDVRFQVGDAFDPPPPYYANTSRVIALPNTTEGITSSTLMKQAMDRMGKDIQISPGNYALGSIHCKRATTQPPILHTFSSVTHLIVRQPKAQKPIGLPTALESLVTELNHHSGPCDIPDRYADSNSRLQVFVPLFGSVDDIDLWVQGISRFRNKRLERMPILLTIIVDPDRKSMAREIQNRLEELGIEHTRFTA